jgi:hypothetical protein
MFAPITMYCFQLTRITRCKYPMIQTYPRARYRSPTSRNQPKKNKSVNPTKCQYIPNHQDLILLVTPQFSGNWFLRLSYLESG